VTYRRRFKSLRIAFSAVGQNATNAAAAAGIRYTEVMLPSKLQRAAAMFAFLCALGLLLVLVTGVLHEWARPHWAVAAAIAVVATGWLVVWDTFRR
jgi:hypothetical protein